MTHSWLRQIKEQAIVYGGKRNNFNYMIWLFMEYAKYAFYLHNYRPADMINEPFKF